MNITKTIDMIEELKQANKFLEAQKLAEQALVEHADDYRLYEEIADIALFEKNYKKAEAMIAHALSLNPESGTGMYLAGYIAISKKDFAKGVDLLHQANANFPNNPEIIRNLGWGYFMLGEGEKGITILRRAMNLAPDDDMIAEDLAVALITTGSFAEGIDLLEKFQKHERLEDLRNLGIIS